jgi:hypothetical protein
MSRLQAAATHFALSLAVAGAIFVLVYSAMRASGTPGG